MTTRLLKVKPLSSAKFHIKNATHLFVFHSKQKASVEESIGSVVILNHFVKYDVFAVRQILKLGKKFEALLENDKHWSTK